MQWSQLKKRIENTFAESVRDRVQVWTTRYRNSHDQVGESWITIDKERFATMGTQSYYNEYYGTAHRLREERECLNYQDPEQRDGYYRAYDEAEKSTKDKGIFASWEFNHSLFEYLNLPFDEAMTSENPIIRAFVLLDRRFGKRRLLEFDPANEHPLVARLYMFRCAAEGIPPRSNPSFNPDAFSAG